MKARPERSEGRKHAGGMFPRAWESPCASERTRMGVGGCASFVAEVLVGRISKVYTNNKKRFDAYASERFLIVGTGLENQMQHPGGVLLATARRSETLILPKAKCKQVLVPLPEKLSWHLYFWI